MGWDSTTCQSMLLLAQGSPDFKIGNQGMYCKVAHSLAPAPLALQSHP